MFGQKVFLLLLHYIYSCAPSAAPPRAARQVPGKCRRAQRGAQVHTPAPHQPPGIPVVVSNFDMDVHLPGVLKRVDQANPPLNPLYFGVFLMFCACLTIQYGRFFILVLLGHIIEKIC